MTAIITPPKIAAVAPPNGCHNCKNAHIVPGPAGVAECRANPPNAFIVPNSQGDLTSIRVWPPIKPGDFCLGGWKLKLHRPDGSIGPSS